MEQQRVSNCCSDEQIQEATEAFAQFDEDNNGYVTTDELGNVLESAGMKMPGYKIRKLVEDFDTKTKDGKIQFDEFIKLFEHLKSTTDIGVKFKKAVNKRQDLHTHGGTSEASVSGTTHSVKHAENAAYADWINRKLMDDKDLKDYGLPLTQDNLFKKTQDGVILCKLINNAVEETIDERTINKTKLNAYTRTENQNLVISSAQAIGCTVVNIGPTDIENGEKNPHLILGMLWQIIRIGLLSEVNIVDHPNLAVLLEEGESVEDLLRLSPEQILIRWVNYQLKKSETDRRVSNFTEDIKDSEAYTYLLHQIAPPDREVSTMAIHISDPNQRAEAMLQEADKMGCRSFIGPAEVVGGHQKLNLAFVANLFNTYPALEQAAVEPIEQQYEETREEKTYRNWMNSLGVDPFVHRLYSDLSSGLVLFQLYDAISPNTVDWTKVHKKFSKLKANFERIENCNYAVELGCKCRFSLVGIGGEDLHAENRTLTLALVWQLMRAYTLALLSRLKDMQEGQTITDSQIVTWANDKMSAEGKKSHVRSFNDQALSNGRIVLDLIDSIKPGSIKWDIVKEGEEDEDKKLNCKYAISMARKIGARVYALPEDILEVKPKMILTIFACLMIKDLTS
ncbi:plastin-3-like [Mizuhopecten yessoensis]|uniref:Plastin-3 n=1 Tax=Mizuhopecten yessoensis TaxID=6573 RepID=A0A210PLF3_MIZYE|nr:plastin-3-like [Mizuhopecten yessoensis]OWF37322.1 Plastin-3 [Mizuhopecten yessoensis]